MNNCVTDALTPIQKLCEERLGKRVAPPTIWRWIHKGCHGVKLQAVRVAGCWMTTPAAWGAFLEGQTAAALSSSESVEIPEEDEATTRRLTAAGLI